MLLLKREEIHFLQRSLRQNLHKLESPYKVRPSLFNIFISKQDKKKYLVFLGIFFNSINGLLNRIHSCCCCCCCFLGGDVARPIYKSMKRIFLILTEFLHPL